MHTSCPVSSTTCVHILLFHVQHAHILSCAINTTCIRILVVYSSVINKHVFAHIIGTTNNIWSYCPVPRTTCTHTIPCHEQLYCLLIVGCHEQCYTCNVYSGFMNHMCTYSIVSWLTCTHILPRIMTNMYTLCPASMHMYHTYTYVPVSCREHGILCSTRISQRREQRVNILSSFINYY